MSYNISNDRTKEIINNILAEMEKADIEVPSQFSPEEAGYIESLNYLTNIIAVHVDGHISKDDYFNFFKKEVGMSDEEIAMGQITGFCEPKYFIEGEN